ncbi:aconitase X swivel domain-containing protein [Bacteroidota bacterium]
MGKTYKVRKIVRGKAEAEAIVLNGSFSFLGDIDMGNAEIIAEGNPNKGLIVKDKILIYKDSKGSSGGMVVLMTLGKKGIAPAAIVTVEPVDYNLAEGAILAKVPFVCEPDGDILNEIKTGEIVRVDADRGELEQK